MTRLPGGRGGGGRWAHQCRCAGGWAGPGKAAGHSFATPCRAGVSMMGCAVLRSRESISGRDLAAASGVAVPVTGVMTCTTTRRPVSGPAPHTAAGFLAPRARTW
jgi:hypothetical protein